MGPTGPNVATFESFVFITRIHASIHSTNVFFYLLTNNSEDRYTRLYYTVDCSPMCINCSAHRVIPGLFPIYMVVYIGSPRSSFSLLAGQSYGSTPLRQRGDCSDVQGLSIAERKWSSVYTQQRAKVL